MSTIKLKHKAALDYLFDGKDPLSNIPKGNYVKQYEDYLFSEKNVRKNLQAANKLIQKVDKIISIDNIDKKQLLNNGKGNTAPSTPNKKQKQKLQLSNELFQNINSQNKTNQSEYHLSNGLLNTPKYQYNLMENMQDSKIQNKTSFVDDKSAINQVQKSKLHERTVSELQHKKQFQDKEKYNETIEQQQTSVIQRSSSAEVFIPFGKERNSLGYIIDPTKQYGIEQNTTNKNIPIERQKISLIVPPQGAKVLVMKRGVHFFDKGIGLKSKRDDNEIIFSKANSYDITNPFLSTSQNSQIIQNQNLLQSCKIKGNVNKINGIDDQNQSNISSPKYPNTQIQSSQQNSYIKDQNYQNSIDDQSSILKLINEKGQFRSELSSSNNLTSKNTTFHYNGQPRYQSQDQMLVLLNQNKIPDYENIQNIKKEQNQLLNGFNKEQSQNKEYIHKQKGQYYITPKSCFPDNTLIKNDNDSEQLQNKERPNSSTINQASTMLQLSQIENSKHYLNEIQNLNVDKDNSQQDYQQNINGLQNNIPASNQSSHDYICNDPACVNHGQAFILTPEIIEYNKEKQNIIYKKNKSLSFFKPPSQSEIFVNNFQGHQSSKTMQLDKKNKDINLYFNQDIQINEKVDRSASLYEGSKNNISNSQNQIQFMEVKMKQNKGGSVSEFEIGKFVLLPELSNENPNSQRSNFDQQNGIRSISPIKKFTKIDKERFKWKMNALDQAQLIELMIKERESKIKLPKIFIYNKKKYEGEKYSSPGCYDPKYECIEKHSRQVYFDKANLKQLSPSPNRKQNNLTQQQQTPNKVPQGKKQQQQKNKEEGYEIMFSELMKDIKKEVRQQKVNNKELKHPMQGLQLNAIPHSNIIELNKNYGNQINYCKTCINSLKYYLRSENPTFTKRQAYILKFKFFFINILYQNYTFISDTQIYLFLFNLNCKYLKYYINVLQNLIIIQYINNMNYLNINELNLILFYQYQNRYKSSNQ